MANRTFADRAEAGRLLGREVAARGLADPVVLGLPRGGVVVAAHVAAAAGTSADVLVARKIGHPAQPELGLGAIAEGGEPVYDERALRATGLRPEDLARTVAAEREELSRRVALYRGDRDRPDVRGRTVVLVDDGVATGVTARAALRALRTAGANRLVLAAPVAAPGSLRDLADDMDDAVVLEAPARFGAVGRWYAAFGQVSDEEVLAVLRSPPAAPS